MQWRSYNPKQGGGCSHATGHDTRRDGKTYYSATQLSRLFTPQFEQADIKGASAQSGRRTLAVKLKHRGIDVRHVSEILRSKAWKQ
jgi:hypothetical protein